MYPQKDRNLEESDALIRALAWNDAFGCYTRAGFEKLIWPEIADRARWIIYFDIDGMHAINETHQGYDAADAMIKETLAVLRLTDYVAGQWKSGDEFLICVIDGGPRSAVGDQRLRLGDPRKMMERLIDELAKHGMTATFAVVPVVSAELVENVQPAVDQVYAAKGQRGDRR